MNAYEFAIARVYGRLCQAESRKPLAPADARLQTITGRSVEVYEWRENQAAVTGGAPAAPRGFA